VCVCVCVCVACRCASVQSVHRRLIPLAIHVTIRPILNGAPAAILDDSANIIFAFKISIQGTWYIIVENTCFS